MAQYINKSALVAEIEKLKFNLIYSACSSQIAMETRCKEEAYNEVLSFLDTLKVKEVNLDEEFDKYCETLYLIDLENDPYAELFECAKHFFELGLKSKNE